MKFITRELYNALQCEPDSFEHRNAAERWKRSCEEYRMHFTSIEHQLPHGMREFSQVTLHDGVVRSVKRPDDSQLELVIDATRNPWGPRGIFRICFTGVTHVEAADNLVGDDWLYEEVHLDAVGFDYRVLFWKSDFRVIGGDVAAMEISAKGANGNPGRAGG